MADYVQISAQISEATRRRLDQYARETGIKKSRIVEDAIEQHLSALDELPAEYVVPTQVVLTRESFEAVLAEMATPAAPLEPLVRAMHQARHHRDAD